MHGKDAGILIHSSSIQSANWNSKHFKLKNIDFTPSAHQKDSYACGIVSTSKFLFCFSIWGSAITSCIFSAPCIHHNTKSRGVLLTSTKKLLTLNSVPQKEFVKPCRCRSSFATWSRGSCCWSCSRPRTHHQHIFPVRSRRCRSSFALHG